MWFLVCSVLLNTLLAVIFRSFTKYKINNFAAIVVNYLACFIVGVFMTKGEILDLTSIPSSWIPVLLVLGTIFIVTFNAVAATVQIFGITIATLVQKMSVLMVVIFAILYYDEQLNLMRIVGLLAGFVSIFLISGRPKKMNASQKSWIFISLPIIVFLMGGTIDSTFVHLSKLNITAGREDAFAAYLFGTAGILGLVYLLFTWLIKGVKYQVRDIWAGIILGIPNFFTVFFIQKMLMYDMDGSIIFPIHNIAILVLSAVVSKLFFDESFNKMKLIGVILAATAIIILALAS